VYVLTKRGPGQKSKNKVWEVGHPVVPFQNFRARLYAVDSLVETFSPYKRFSLFFKARAAKPDSQRIIDLIRTRATGLTILSGNVLVSKISHDALGSSVRTSKKQTVALSSHSGIRTGGYFVSPRARCDKNA
jgi:hypothetical protein